MAFYVGGTGYTGSNENCGCVVAVCCSGTMALLGITFLVLGILGDPGVAALKMAPIGSQIMLGLGVIMIASMIRCCCGCR